ncbi:MAG TPA: hypothetical protein VEQ85_09000 [Lacipirellulaceae bacterium]|nr:hypothetical protein [Lacipirellulaceae bacterium]
MANPAFRTAPRVLLAIALSLGGATRSQAQGAAPAAPEILGVQVGFAGAYKLGCWTALRAKVRGGHELPGLRIEAVTADSDGVATTFTAPLQVGASETIEAELVIRVGRDGAPLTVRLVDSQGELHASRSFYPTGGAESGGLRRGLPATTRLVLLLGAREDFAAALARDEEAEPTADIRTKRLASARDLPLQWSSYESVDTVILSGAQVAAYADRTLLAERIDALARWVELGGRAVLFCGSTAEQVIGEHAPLRRLAPGRFTGKFVPLVDVGPLEIFSGALAEITPGDERLRIPQLENVAGQRLAEGPAKLPLVVRTRRGLGEITFVAIDPEAEPIASWSERPSLLRQSLEWPAPAPDAANDRLRALPAAPDLVNQLRSALDQQFQGVQTTSFGLVALLVVGYIALVGPGDYFFLKRVLRRMELTWITFPAIVLGVSGLAYAMTYRMKGDEPRVNQVEIVDVDVATGQARGTVWTHWFNPHVQRYDLSLTARFGGEGTVASARAGSPAASPARETRVGWLGVPGAGLGAMQDQGGQNPLFDEGYAFDETLTAVDGLPIEPWSTKTLAAHWSGPVAASVEAELEARGDDQLTGRVTNRTSVRLEDCLLMHGGWAYTLPPLEPGGTARLDELTPRSIKTALTSVAAGDDPHVRIAEDGSVAFDALSTDVARITKLMMFFDAVGGDAYVRTPHRYQAQIDMTRLLRGNQSVLLARAPADAGSHWNYRPSNPASDPARKTAAPQPLASEGDRRWTYYRFVIPLAEADVVQPAPAPMMGPSPVP